MKVRNGFVSNSSSSSFICDVCGEDASGWDIGLEEAGMYECVNGHVFCEDHALEVDDKELCIVLLKEAIKSNKESFEEYGKDYYEEDMKKYQALLENIDDEDYDEIKEIDDLEFRYSVPEICCPLCQFKSMTDGDALKFLLKKEGKEIDDVLKEVKENYSSYKDFKEAL